MAQGVKGDQAESAKRGVTAADTDHEKHATIRSEIDFTRRIRNKIKKSDQKASAHVDQENR
jgi:hypothetical protein